MGCGKEKVLEQGLPVTGPQRPHEFMRKLTSFGMQQLGKGTFGVATETHSSEQHFMQRHMQPESTMRTSWRPAQQFSQQPSAQQTA